MSQHRIRVIRREEWLKGKVCADCASSSDYLAASWKVHPGPFATSRIWQFGDAEKRQGYLADCLVLCRCCRARNANASRKKGHGEGTHGVRGCFCDPCKAGRAKAHRERRARLKRERGQ